MTLRRFGKLTPLALLAGSLVIAAGLMIAGMACDEIKDDYEEPGLDLKVDISRDAKGVWFITGSASASLRDVFEGMGYAVAEDRLWQMETYRRSATGRLAEILGPSYLNNDVLVRTIGYSMEELQAGYASLDQESRQVLDGFVSGINMRIAEIKRDSTKLPVEFAGLKLEIETWTAEQVLAWLALLQRNFDPEATQQGQIDNARFMQELAITHPPYYQAMFQDLRWINDQDALTYLSEADMANRPQHHQSSASELASLPSTFPDWREAARKMAERAQAYEKNLEQINAQVKMGSYAWVVDGEKTESGNPIIYSGPQMGFPVPSIVTEGSIRAGGLNISGMTVPGIPGIIIGRTPNHAWSMQVGHAHTVDFYAESPATVTLHRLETIKVKGQADVILPVWRSSHGPIVNPLPYDPENYDPTDPLIAWKYAHWGHEFAAMKAFLAFARAQSVEEFGQGIEYLAVSQHFCYADRAGNIAYWMSGRDPQRPAGEYRLPQGFAGAPQEWDSNVLIARSHDANTERGYYCGWNNKSNPDYKNSPNNYASYNFGPFHRAHVVDEYLAATNDLTFEQVRDLALNIATTDSFGAGGNPWTFVREYFIDAINQNSTPERQAAIAMLEAWDGHFVDGGQSNWVTGTMRADAWVLMDTWIKEAIRLTFEDELQTVTMTYRDQPNFLLFNTMLHGLRGSASAIQNYYPWFTNASDSTKPQTANDIIVTALDNSLAALGEAPWNVARGYIVYTHSGLGMEVWRTLFSSRSTYAQCVELGSSGPTRIVSMFPLGQSGDIRLNEQGAPTFNQHFFSMTPEYDSFSPRSFPVF